MECQWVYKSHLRVSPIPSSGWPKQNKCNGVLVLYCFVWALKILTGLLLLYDLVSRKQKGKKLYYNNSMISRSHVKSTFEFRVI